VKGIHERGPHDSAADISSKPKRDRPADWMGRDPSSSRSADGPTSALVIGGLQVDESRTMRPPMSGCAAAGRSRPRPPDGGCLVSVVRGHPPRVARAELMRSTTAIRCISNDDAAAGRQLHLVGVGGSDLAFRSGARKRDVVGVESQATLATRPDSAAVLWAFGRRPAVHQHLADQVER